MNGDEGLLLSHSVFVDKFLLELNVLIGSHNILDVQSKAILKVPAHHFP